MPEKRELKTYIWFIWLTIVLALAGVALIAINLNQSIQKEGELAFHKNLRFISESSAKSAKLFMESLISEIVFQTQLEAVKKYDTNKVDAAFRSAIFRHNERISHMVLVDGTGTVKVIVTDDPEPFQMKDQFIEFSKNTMSSFRVNISTGLFRSDNYQGIAVGMPIFRKLTNLETDGNTPSAIYASGAVMALLRLDDIVASLVEPVRVEKSGFAWLYTGSGNILGDKEYIGKFLNSAYGPSGSVDRLTKDFAQIVKGNRVDGWSYLDPGKEMVKIEKGGAMWLLSTSKIDIVDQQWTMAVLAPLSEVTGLLTTSFNQSVMLVGFVVAIMLIGGYFLTNVNRRLVRAREKALMAAELESKNRSLQEMNQRMDEFVSVVSHDIRSPLNVIKGFVKVIKGSPEGAVFERETKSMLRSCDRLTQLINDILDISKLESGTVSLAYDPIVIDNIITESLQTMEFATKEKELKVDIDLGEKTVMEGDSGKLFQVMNNLIGNAVKFTPKGGEIAVSKETDDETVIIKVKDTGPGIDVRDHGIVFSKFEQVRRHQQGVEPGSGLGLSICKNIVELHFGTIGVESRKNGGSTFQVILPLRRPLPKFK